MNKIKIKSYGNVSSKGVSLEFENSPRGAFDKMWFSWEKIVSELFDVGIHNVECCTKEPSLNKVKDKTCDRCGKEADHPDCDLCIKCNEMLEAEVKPEKIEKLSKDVWTLSGFQLEKELAGKINEIIDYLNKLK